MKRKFKTLITAFAVCSVSAFAVMASGCNGLKESINELRCDHVMVDGEVTKEPTCQEEGEMLKECTLCTYTETETLDKLKHAVVILKAVSPSCTKSGLTEGQKCADCDEILVAQKVIAPTGHKVVIDNAVEPTCSTVGKTEGSHCENCDTVFVEQKDVPMLEHVLKETEAYSATCEETGFTGGTKCENCDYATEGEIIPALDHSYDDGVVTTEATCEVDGEKSYTCATCEGTKIEAILATGHTFENGTCTVCGIDEQQLISFTVIVTDGSGEVMSSYTSTATKGSSWAEWVASTNFEIAYGGAPIVTDNNLVCCPGGDRYYLKEVAGYNGRSITADEIIQENTVYYFSSKSP